MDFAFIIHPMNVNDIVTRFKGTKRLPREFVEKWFSRLPAFKYSKIEGIKSQSTGRTISGIFIGCPLTTEQMLSFPEHYVVQKIIKAGRVAEKAGAGIVGLGAMTSVVADAGITIAQQLKIPVTTGNSYTVAMAMEGTKEAAAKMGIDIAEAHVVVIGATGAIGAVCSHLVSRECKYLTLIVRDRTKLDNLARSIMHQTGQAVKITNNLKKALKSAQIVITVTSSGGDIIQPEDLPPGCVVCDVARPRDVSRRVASARKDVLVIEGGLVQVPGKVTTNLNLGYPPDVTLACIAETMILAMENRFESYTLGRSLTFEQVDEIYKLGEKHGFKLAGLRSFEKPVTAEEIRSIRDNAGHGASTAGIG
jgi:fatty aldehyde-generating acyl-ACP reductase